MSQAILKSIRAHAVGVNEAAEYIEKGGPLSLPLRKAVRRLVAASARYERELKELGFSVIGEDGK